MLYLNTWTFTWTMRVVACSPPAETWVCMSNPARWPVAYRSRCQYAWYEVTPPPSYPFSGLYHAHIAAEPIAEATPLFSLSHCGDSWTAAACSCFGSTFQHHRGGESCQSLKCPVCLPVGIVDKHCCSSEDNSTFLHHWMSIWVTVTPCIRVWEESVREP